MLKRLFAALPFVVAFAGGADAAVVSVLERNDRAVFLNDVVGETLHIPGSTSFVTSGLNLGPMTFSAEPGSNVGFGSNFSSLIAGNELAQSGVENFNIDFTQPTFAFGMDVHDPSVRPTPDGCNTVPCFDTTFGITLLDSADNVLHSTLFDPFFGNQLSFIGFISAVAIDRIEVRDLTNDHDNEYFGNFVTAAFPQPAVSAVPLPAPFALLLSGLAGLGLMARRRS